MAPGLLLNDFDTTTFTKTLDEPIKKCRDEPIHANRHMRVIAMGAGPAGIFLAYKMQRLFTDYTLQVFEKNDDVGGTWFENKYPGCACDIPAHNFIYSFEGKPDFSANYATGREILQYYSDFVDKYDLRRYIKCKQEIVKATWDESKSEWAVIVKDRASGTSREMRCDFFINAGGILNNWTWPDLKGLHDFKGELIHTAAWNENLDLSGKRVGLIGNGASAVQVLPQLQRTVGHLTTFIRTPAWVSPARGMEYHEYTDEEKWKFENDPDYYLDVRKKIESELNECFPVFLKGTTPQAEARDHTMQAMKEKLNNDDLAAKLIPDFEVGCRRYTPGVGYLESLSKPNVSVVYGNIDRVTPIGIIDHDGSEHELDVLVCATGFDTTFRPRFPIVGRDKSLSDMWEHEPRSYLSVCATSFPNYFMYLGPSCTISNGPVIFAIEIETEYFAQFMNRWQKENIASYDPKREAVDDFMEQKDLYMERTVWMSTCNSWYRNRKLNKVTALWPGNTLHFMETLADVRWEDFDIRYKTRNRFAYMGNGFSQWELRPGNDTAYYIRAKDDDTPICKRSMSTYNAKIYAQQKIEVKEGNETGLAIPVTAPAPISVQ